VQLRTQVRTAKYTASHSKDNNPTMQILHFLSTITFYRGDVSFRTLVRRRLPVLMLNERRFISKKT